jgi:hypothetical protein
MVHRAARRPRRADSTGPARRVADPFRGGLGNIFNGTATGRFGDPTAVETTAVTARRAATGSSMLGS